MCRAALRPRTKTATANPSQAKNTASQTQQPGHRPWLSRHSQCWPTIAHLYGEVIHTKTVKSRHTNNLQSTSNTAQTCLQTATTDTLYVQGLLHMVKAPQTTCSTLNKLEAWQPTRCNIDREPVVSQRCIMSASAQPAQPSPNPPAPPPVHSHPLTPSDQMHSVHSCLESSCIT